MSKELIVVENNDVVVYEDKTAFISQRKLAELLDVDENTLKMHVFRTHKNYNTSKGLDAFLVVKCTHYFATKSRVKSRKAIDLTEKFMVVGATAYLYTLAGYRLNAEPPKPAQHKIDKPIPSLMRYRQEIIRPILNQHNVLMGLVDYGVLDVNIKTIKKYTYKVTEFGKSLGYYQNSNGTVFEPNNQ